MIFFSYIATVDITSSNAANFDQSIGYIKSYPSKIILENPLCNLMYSKHMKCVHRFPQGDCPTVTT